MDATISTAIEQALTAGKPAKLDIKPEHFGARIQLSVKTIKEGGGVVKIKQASDADVCVARVHPGGTVSIRTSVELYAECAKDTALTITI